MRTPKLKAYEVNYKSGSYSYVTAYSLKEAQEICDTFDDDVESIRVTQSTRWIQSEEAYLWHKQKVPIGSLPVGSLIDLGYKDAPQIGEIKGVLPDGSIEYFDRKYNKIDSHTPKYGVVLIESEEKAQELLDELKRKEDISQHNLNQLIGFMSDPKKLMDLMGLKEF